MHAWTRKGAQKQSFNLAVSDGDEIGDVGEGARGGRPLANKLGFRVRYLLQSVDV